MNWTPEDLEIIASRATDTWLGMPKPKMSKGAYIAQVAFEVMLVELEKEGSNELAT